MFPSPYGDCGSYQLLKKLRMLAATLSFRPLTGIMVLIEREKKIAWYENYAFPSPYGDCGSYHEQETA